MRSLRFAVFFTLFLFLGSALQADDSADLKGEWDVVESTYDGKTASKEDFQIAKLVFDGKKLTITGKQRSKEFSYTLDPKKEPKELNLTMLTGPYKGKENPAIYELDGESLKVCSANDPTNPKRPGEFKAEKGTS